MAETRLKCVLHTHGTHLLQSPDIIHKVRWHKLIYFYVVIFKKWFK